MTVHEGHRERLRARYIAHGFSGMQEHEVLELILFYVIPRRDTNGIAHELIAKYGGLRAVLTAPVSQLSQEKFISESGATLLNIIGKASELTKYYEKVKVLLNTPAKVARYVRELLSSKPKEELWILLLDAKDVLISAKKVASGTVNTVVGYNREIIQDVLNSNAVSVVLAHNHPAGNIAPSRADMDMTAKMHRLLDAAGVNLYDHVIACDDGYYSFRSQCSYIDGKEGAVPQKIMAKYLHESLFNEDDFKFRK